MIHPKVRNCGNLLMLGLMAVLILSLATPLNAAFNGTPQLIGIPTADAQTYGSLLINLNGSIGLNSNEMSPGFEPNLNIGFSPVDHLTLDLTAYTPSAYVLGASYQLLGNNSKTALAVGINDVGIKSHVGALGNGVKGVFPDERYVNEPDENLSLFAVTSVPVGSVVRLHVGLGRGEYVGYARGRYPNTDILFGSTRHQWAFGLFGGAEARIGSHGSVAADVDGRDVNAGVKVNLGHATVDLALTKIEGFTEKKAGDEFPRISAAVSYQINGLLHAKPQPAPAPKPGPIVVKPGMLNVKVVSKATGSPIASAQLTLTPSESHNSADVQTVTTDQSGSYAFPNVRPGSYVVSAQSPGYVAQSSEQAVASGETTSCEIALEAPPAPPVSVAPLNLKPIYFRFDRYDLSDSALLTLKANAGMIKQHPGVKIAILGLCSEEGTHEYNLRLGEKRARAAYDYLLNAGIDPALLSFRSLGKQKAGAGVPLWTYRRDDFEQEK